MPHETRMPKLTARLSERNHEALEALLAEEDETNRKRGQLDVKGPNAWARLARIAKGDTGQSHHCRRILLSVYNGSAWPLDPTRLRVIDRELQDAALTVIEWSIHSVEEPHEYTPGGNALMQRFWAIETGKED